MSTPLAEQYQKQLPPFKYVLSKSVDYSPYFGFNLSQQRYEGREVFPQNVRPARQDYTLANDNRRYGFSTAIAGEFVFNNEGESKDFDYLYEREQSGDKCRILYCHIYRLCLNVFYGSFAIGILRLANAKFDLDACTITVPLEVINTYTCLEDQWQNEINLFEGNLARQTVKILRGEIQKIDYNRSTYLVDDPAVFGGLSPSAFGYRLYRVEYYSSGALGTPPTYYFYYAREVVTLPAPDDPGPGWIMISAPGPSQMWARQPILGNYTELFVNNTPPPPGQAPIRHFGGDLFAYEIVGDTIPDELDNGILLNDVFNFYINSYCGYTYKSNFFRHLADYDFADQYPTLNVDRTDLADLIFQKSDVKRPGSQNNATKAITTFEKLLLGVCELYNLWYQMDPVTKVFRIEHVSWFEREQTLDLTENKYRRFVNNTRRYSYDTQTLPKKEVYKTMEAGSKDFVGMPIEYVGDCVQTTGTAQDKQHSAGDITTDFEYAIQNSSPDSNKVSDSGLFLMCCKFEDPDYFMQMADPILESSARLNGLLSWAYLHKFYHMHERLQKNGYLNGRYTTFTTTKPIKRRDRIAIKFCCDDVIDLNGTVNSEMGVARIGGASMRMYEDMLELDLLYPDHEGNNACLRVRSFTFINQDGDDFEFNTLFEAPGFYKTQIEYQRPDGTFGKKTLTGDQDGHRITEITGPDGLYNFRKRVICESQWFSEWSDWVPVEKSAVVGGSGCTVIEDAISFHHQGSSYSIFYFHFVTGVYTGYVQAEITRPDGAVFLRHFNDGHLVTGFYFVRSYDANMVPLVPAPTSGLYRFRFRKICDATAGIYGPWSAYVDVNI